MDVLSKKRLTKSSRVDMFNVFYSFLLGEQLIGQFLLLTGHFPAPVFSPEHHPPRLPILYVSSLSHPVSVCHYTNILKIAEAAF